MSLFSHFKKRFLLIALILIVLFVGGIGLVLLNVGKIIDKNKGLVLTKAEQVLGRQVRVESIQVSLWTGVGIQLSKFDIADDPTYSGTSFISAESVDVYFKLIPLFRKQLEISHLTLQKPIFQIIRNKEGQFNYTSLLNKKPVDKETGNQEGSSPDSSSSPSPSDKDIKKDPSNIVLSLNRLEIEDGQVIYMDQSKSQEIQLKQINSTIQNLTLDQSFPLQLEAALFSDQQNLAFKGQVGPIHAEGEKLAMNGDIQIDNLSLTQILNHPSVKSFIPENVQKKGNVDGEVHVEGTLDDLLVKLNLKAALFSDQRNITLQGQVGPIRAESDKLAFNGDINFDDLSLTTLSQFSSLKSALPEGLQTKGSVKGDIHLEGSLNDLLIKLNLDGKKAGIQYNQKYEKAEGVPLRIALQSKIRGEAIDLQNVQIEQNPFEINGTGNVQLGKRLAYNITVQTKPIDVSALVPYAPMIKEYQPAGKITVQAAIQSSEKAPRIQGSMMLENLKAHFAQIPKPMENLSGKIQFEGNTAKTEGVTFQVGQSKFNVRMDVKQWSPIQAKINFGSDRIALVDVMNPSEKMQKDALENVLIEGNLSLSKIIHTDGTVSSKQGTFSGLKYTNLKSPFALQDNILAMDPISFQTLGGEIEGKIQYNMQQKPPQFDIATQTKNVDLAQLIQTKVSWFPNIVEGKVNMNLDMAGNGNTWDIIKNSLKGNGTASISDGKILNVNIADSLMNRLFTMPELSQFITTKYKDEYPAIFASQDTEFQDLKIETAIQDGKVNFNNILITAADWVINGQGWMNFDQNLESDHLLRLSKNFTSFLTGKVGLLQYMADENGNLSIPFSMSGLLPTIKATPNSDFVGGILQKAVAGKITNKLNLQGIPGLSNILQLPLNQNQKIKKTNLPPIPADKVTASSKSKSATQTTSATRTTKQSAPQRVKSSTAELLSATPTITVPTKITPTDVINPLMNLLKKKK